MSRSLGEPFRCRSASVSLAGGLGNQLFQLAAAMYVAKGAPVRVLAGLNQTRQASVGRVDLLDFTVPDTVTIHDYVGSGLRSRMVRRASALALSASVRRGRVRSTTARIAGGLMAAEFYRDVSFDTIFVPRGIGYDPRMEQLQGSPLLIGYFQSWKTAMNPDVQAILSAMTLRRSSTWLDGLAKLAETEHPVVVHIRMGDYRREQRFGFPGVGYLSRSWKELAQSDSVGRVWLFSDEPKEATEILDQAGVHSDVRVVGEPDGGASPASVLSAMRLGRAFVLANSSFSWWAAALSGVSGDRVCAPDPWFKNPLAPPDLYPPGWLRVTAHEEPISAE